MKIHSNLMLLTFYTLLVCACICVFGVIGDITIVARCGTVDAQCSSWSWKGLLLASREKGIAICDSAFLFFFTFLTHCGCIDLIVFLLFVQLIYSKYDEVGVILFGTEGMFWISNGFFGQLM